MKQFILYIIMFLCSLDPQEERSAGDGVEDAEQVETVDKMEEEEDEADHWSIEEKEKLLQFVTKVFLMNFPSYMAYKHMVHSSLEVHVGQLHYS